MEKIEAVRERRPRRLVPDPASPMVLRRGRRVEVGVGHLLDGSLEVSSSVTSALRFSFLLATAPALLAWAAFWAVSSAAMAAVTVARGESGFGQDGLLVIAWTMACAMSMRAGTTVGSCSETRARLTALVVVVAPRVLGRGRLLGFLRCESRGGDAELRLRRHQEAGRHASLGSWSTTLLSRRPLEDSRGATFASPLAKLSSSDAKEMSSVAKAPERCAKQGERGAFWLEGVSLAPENQALETSREAIETWTRSIRAESVVLLPQGEATNGSSWATER